MVKDLRYFLETLEEKNPELLLRIRKEVSPKWQVSSIQKRLEVDGKLPAIMFEKVEGHDMRLVTNLFATKQHLAVALDTSPENVVSRFADAVENPTKPRAVEDGPVKDVVLKGDEADLRKLPIVTHCEKDAGPYISSGVTIIRDPISGCLNAGIYRNLYLSPHRLTANFAPLSDAERIALKAEAQGKDVDAAIVIGHHPTMAMASQYRSQLGEFELDIMGTLLGEPVPLIPCETVDVPVPAHAEIVIEGKIRAGSREVDGPFGDYWLYYGHSRETQVFEVTAITRRHDAIFHDLFNVGPEHVVLFSLGMEGLAFSQLKQLIPQVKAVDVPASGSGNLIYVQISKDLEGLGINAALAALGIYRFKCAVVVDEDIDILDDKRVLWAVMTRTQADRSFFFVPGTYISSYDPTCYPTWQSVAKGEPLLSTRLGIDATKPLDPTFPEVAEPPRSMWSQIDLNLYLSGARTTSEKPEK